MVAVSGTWETSLSQTNVTRKSKFSSTIIFNVFCNSRNFFVKDRGLNSLSSQRAGYNFRRRALHAPNSVNIALVLPSLPCSLNILKYTTSACYYLSIYLNNKR